MVLVGDLLCAHSWWSCELMCDEFGRVRRVLWKKVTLWTPQPCIKLALELDLELDIPHTVRIKVHRKARCIRFPQRLVLTNFLVLTNLSDQLI